MFPYLDICIGFTVLSFISCIKLNKDLIIIANSFCSGLKLFIFVFIFIYIKKKKIN